MLASAIVLVLVASSVPPARGAEPAPPYPRRPEPTARPAYSPSPYVSPPVVVAPPPPLSPLVRVLYAPFYAAGLVVRYGVYYLIVAPLEVFGRTVEYGARGGVERTPPPPPVEEEP
jgi:hypothetical protein